MGYMRTPMVKQEEETHTRIMAKEEEADTNMEERSVGTERNHPKQGITSTKVPNQT